MGVQPRRAEVGRACGPPYRRASLIFQSKMSGEGSIAIFPCFMAYFRHMKKYPYLVDIALVAGLLAVIAAPSFAVTMPSIGAASGYAIIDSLTPNAQAKADVQNAYNQILAMACTSDMTNQNLNNQRLGAGVYCFSTPTVLNGQVLLDAHGDQNAVFIFKMASRFDVWPDAEVLLIGGTQPQNVFWLAGGAVSIGTSANFAGTVITIAPIWFGRGGDAPVFDERGTVNGRLWSIGSTVSVPSRVVVGFITPTVTSYVVEPQPEPQAVQQPTGALLSVIVNEPGFVPFVNGMRVASGMKNPLPAGTYTVSEINTSAVEYGTPSFSVGCSQNGLTGLVTLNAGDDKVCVINNTTFSVYGGNIAMVPHMPNTGVGGSYLPLFNLIGLMLVAAFVWQETSYGKRFS